jgi:hypothetical protein
MPSRRRLVLTIAAAALGLAVLAAPAMAATKPFSVVVSPGSVAAGQSTTFSVTLTNRTSQQQLGSANITVPSAFTAVSVADPPGAATATTNGDVVQLRNAGVAPGASIVVSVTATVPTTCMATYGWSVVAKQANDFNGPPGNDLTLDPPTSSLTTSVAGGCALRFIAGRQPAASRVNQTISALDYQPGGPSVQVEVIDGAGHRVTTSTASITVALGPSTGAGTLHGTLTVSASEGVASFGNLSIDAPGTYTLRATNGGLSAATSSTFRVDQVAVACIEDVTCSASIANGSTTFDVTAPGNAGTDAGFLVLDNGVGVAIDCSGYTELTATPTVIEGPDRAKTVTSTIDKSVMNAQPNNGASFLQMCFGAPYTFATRPGSTLTGVDTNGDSVDDFFYGLLPDCGAPPCVSSRKKTNAGDGVITTQTPGGAQDPAYRP